MVIFFEESDFCNFNKSSILQLSIHLKIFKIEINNFNFIDIHFQVLHVFIYY